MVPCV